MGKVGRSYPRLEAVSEPCGRLAETGDDSAFQARLGAVIGVVCALGVIAWLMALLLH
ncbi:MAG TPA: hypothetical protein VH600_22105 [Burkholderiales bacterium]|jgi:hypothetical protein